MTLCQQSVSRSDGRKAAAETVAALHAEGLNGLQIAARLGISKSYAYELLADPTGEDARRRKARAGGRCVDCGAVTSYATGGPAERCQPCASEAQREWSCERITAAMVDWCDLFGEPPTAADWNLAYSRLRGWSWRVERYESTARAWPQVSTVAARFGSWNAAIEAAGFTAVYGGHKRSELEARAA